MRTIPVVAVSLAGLGLATPARADGFAEVAGGVMIPVEDSQWNDYVESGPKLAIRLGDIRPSGIGGMLSADWSPLTTDADGDLGGALDVSSHRFRILLHAVTHRRIGAKLSASARIGAGIDIAHVNVRSDIFGIMSEASDTDSGLALEAAGGIWFDAGSVQLGVELALPLAFHADGDGEDVDLNDYSSFDIDLMFGVRFLSR